MAKKAARGLDPHTPVTNAPEEKAQVGKTASRPPNEGKNPRTTKPGPEGAEQVEGFQPRARLEGVEPELKAPDTSALRDIAEASFGPLPAQLETVHGPDDRVQIKNTSPYPWRVHCSLLITAADNSSWIGTGWFIGPRTLMTAGHVVFITNSGVPGRDGWVKRIQVMPGRNGSKLPYGSVTSTSFWSVTGWTGGGGEHYDYGAIILPKPLGDTVGWFGFGVYSDADLKASMVNISGYPGDKPSGTQWYDARTVDSVDPRKVYYDIDTYGGQSGSAAYRIIDGGRYAVAIHAYGGPTTNSGTRIVTPVFNNMVAWKG